MHHWVLFRKRFCILLSQYFYNGLEHVLKKGEKSLDVQGWLVVYSNFIIVIRQEAISIFLLNYFNNFQKYFLLYIMQSHMHGCINFKNTP